MPHITIKGLTDLLPQCSPQQARATVAACQPDTATFENKLSHDPALQENILALEQWIALEFDYPQGHSLTKQTSIYEIAKKLTHHGLQYSSFLKPFRPAQVIRLSVSYQPNVSSKMGIKLSPSSTVTPWHGVLVNDCHGNFLIKHCKDIATTDTPVKKISSYRR